MPQQFENVDSGKAFDWGRTSRDYAKYRDIYPDEKKANPSWNGEQTFEGSLAV